MDNYFSSLYIHVPFCVKKCNYCGFYSITYNENAVESYLSALLNEMELTSQIHHKIETIYIGGGTPSCLNVREMEKIFEFLIKKYSISDNIEFTVEVNPGTIDREKVSLFKSFGVNRISIGVQSFIDSELIFLGRIHTCDEAKKTIDLVLNSGIDNVSIDLIYGIPGQGVDNLLYSLDIASRLDIKHISIYELSIEKNTYFEKELNQKSLSLLDDELIITMYLEATEFLEKRDFLKYEISNFAKRYYECRHNINYWFKKPYLGLGPSASSYLNGKRFHNPFDISEYAEHLKIKKLPWIIDCELNTLEDFVESIILGLRMKEGLSVKNPCMIEFFRELEKLDLAKVCESRVSLTDKGMLLSNEIFVKVILHIENCSFCKGVIADHLNNNLK